MASPSGSKHHKVIIVGARLNGILAAKTYLQIKPDVDILIIDSEKSIGGVWAATRIYPGLVFELPAPTMNFSDFDICKELGIEKWGDVTGPQFNDFVVRYAKKYDIPQRCLLNTNVVSIERNCSGWKLFVRRRGSIEPCVENLTCDKLSMATGIISKPKLPKLDVSKFDGFSFHSVDMNSRYQELLADEVKNVTIVGGHKSALEAVGTCSQAGKNVEWLVTSGGAGPPWMMPARDPKGVSKSKKALKRALVALGPSIYHSDRWINRFLYSGRSWLGTWLQNWFWGFMTKEILGDTYTKSENSRKLKPNFDSFFWFVPGATIIHDRDAETLRLVDEGKLIQVSRAQLVSAAGNSITLSTGEKAPSDGIVFCTGLEMAIPPLFSPPLARELGLAVDRADLSEEETRHWQSLDKAAEDEFLELYPIFKDPPNNIHIPNFALTPFRLFRTLVPPKPDQTAQTNILFLGNYATGQVQANAEITSLWGVAYLEGLLPSSTTSILQDKAQMDKDIAWNEAYKRKRLTPMETPEIIDQLMEDLGLRADRKRMRMPGGLRDLFGLRSWISEWFDDYFTSVYEGVVQEFLDSIEKRGETTNPPNKPASLVNSIKKED